jgi:psiF repeat
MSRLPRIVWAAILALLLATSLTLVIAAKASPSNPAASADASSQDKAKACNDAADKKGLTGSDRQKFIQNCLKRAADSGSASNASEQDKAKTCNNLADKKGVTGADRRSFIKDCMKKANPN